MLNRREGGCIRAYSSMVEQRTHNPLVAGSSPAGPTTNRTGEMPCCRHLPFVVPMPVRMRFRVRSSLGVRARLGAGVRFGVRVRTRAVRRAMIWVLYGIRVRSSGWTCDSPRMLGLVELSNVR